jgi:peptide chain release factor 1
MFQKLDSVELRFIELESRLSQESLDGAEFTRIMKERGNLVEIVEVYREYKAALEQQKSAKAMLEDDDAEMRSMAKEELAVLAESIRSLEDQLRVLTLPKDPNDGKNAILEVRAGTGGEEAALFAADLARMYTRYAERQGWKVEILSATESAVGGMKEIILLIQGDNVFRRLKFESGVHRVQRVPETEAQGRIHTSACTVAILPEADEVDDVEINPKDLEIITCRASGAGGQHVNKTDSAIRITHLPTGIVVECQAERSQHKNKEKALKILQARLLENAMREQSDAISANRKEQVGSGDRSERIRTYNFPQGRMTDHRINLTLYKLDDIMEGDLNDILNALATHHQTELLKNQLNSGP